jgi:uncharacterized repeat protein (TIGR01451 family)
MTIAQRRGLAIASMLALLAVLLPMTFASADAYADDTVRLRMTNGAGVLTYQDADAGTSNLEQRFTASKQCAPTPVSGTASLMTWSAAPATGTVGFSTHGLGVKVPGEGNSGKCEQANVPNQVLTLAINTTAGAPLAGRTFDYAELDIEAKFDAAINIALYDGGSQVDADPDSPGMGLVVSCTSSGSDCGPDDSARDNFRVRVPSSGVAPFTEIRLWATATNTSGAVSLEGGADGTAALGVNADGSDDPAVTGLGELIGTSDTIFHVAPTVGLDVTKTADASTVSAGDPIGYTIEVRNEGPGNAYDVTVTDTLPTDAGTSWTIFPVVTGCSIASETLTCDVGALAEDETASVHITSPTTPSTVADSPVTNTATASASNAPTASSGEVAISVLGAGLSVTKTADDGTDTGTTASPSESVTAGATIGFTITVTNAAGAGTARGVTLADELPTGASTSWSISPAVSGCSIASDTLTCEIGDMGPEASFSVHVSSPTTSATIADSPVTNSVSVSSTNGDPLSASASIDVWSGVLGCTPDDPETPEDESNNVATATDPDLADVRVTRLSNIDPDGPEGPLEPAACEEKLYVLTTTDEPPPGGTGDANVVTFDQAPLAGQEGAHYRMEIDWTFPPGTSTSGNPATVGGRTFYIDYGDGVPHEAELCPVVDYDGNGDPVAEMHAEVPWCITGQSYTIDADGDVVLTQYWDGIGDPKVWN